MGECVTLPPEDIPFAPSVRCHGGVGADGTAQLCGLTKHCHTGGTGTVKANIEDWYQGNGPNSRVRPRIECGPDPMEAEAGQGRAIAVKERSIGGPVIQDSYTAHVSTGPSTRRHSTPAASAIPGKETQHS